MAVHPLLTFTPAPSGRWWYRHRYYHSFYWRIVWIQKRVSQGIPEIPPAASLEIDARATMGRTPHLYITCRVTRTSHVTWIFFLKATIIFFTRSQTARTCVWNFRFLSTMMHRYFISLTRPIVEPPGLTLMSRWSTRGRVYHGLRSGDGESLPPGPLPQSVHAPLDAVFQLLSGVSFDNYRDVVRVSDGLCIKHQVWPGPNWETCSREWVLGRSPVGSLVAFQRRLQILWKDAFCCMILIIVDEYCRCVFISRFLNVFFVLQESTHSRATRYEAMLPRWVKNPNRREEAFPDDPLEVFSYRSSSQKGSSSGFSDIPPSTTKKSSI
jgi:hypothetical protein